MPDIVGLDHTGVVVTDLEAAIDFYTEVFGAQLVGREADTEVDPETIGLPGEEVRLRGALLRCGRGLLELHEYLTPRGHESRRPCDVGIGHIAFAVEDIDAVYERLREAGISFNTSPREIETGFYAGRRWVYGRDPWGVVIELCQHPRGGKGHG